MTSAWQSRAALAILAVCAPAGRAETPLPAVPAVVKAEPAPEWDAKFAGKEGWIGGDGVYSAALGPGRVLWLFGDSFLGTVKDGGRAGAVMINNAAGLMDPREKDAVIRFVSGRPKDGKATALFAPEDGKGWFWPQAAVRAGDRLFVFLPRIDRGKGSGAFGFKHIGQWLAVIENPNDAPDKWRVKQHKLPFAEFGPDRVYSWGSAILADDGRLYVYGYQEKGKGIGRRQLTVARVAADKLDDFASWRFRAADGWSAKPADAVALADGLATEFSVGRLPAARGYIAVYTENGLGDRIVARFSKAPDGPWSAPALLFKCPEMARDKGVFCYAAKAHPWAVQGDELLISYCVNTWEFARLFREEKVYRPKFVRVKLATDH